jgi:hypothetical protein
MKILFFSPYALIDVHAIPDALLAKSLRYAGHETLHVSCDGLFNSYCIAMSAVGLGYFDDQVKKDAICRNCKVKRDKINSTFEAPSTHLEKYLAADDFQLADSICAKATPENWFDFEYDGIDVGKYAAYELVLNDKINSKAFTADQWRKYQVDLRNALCVLIGIRKIFDEFRPERVVMYNNLYSANSTVCAVAEQRGVKYYSLHAGGHHVHMRSHITIYRGRGSRRLTPYGQAWKDVQGRPLSPAEIDKVNLHIRELLLAKSPWVYSIKSVNMKSEDLRTFFHAREDQKVLLVTMSSEDEKFAGSLVDIPHQRGEPIFKSYFEWISFLVEWAAKRPDIMLIIRVHPREFPNKRERVLSAQAKIQKDYFVDLPENVKVNWPEDNISLYDLLKIVDLGLNSSSTAGLDMVLFGIPVVIIDENQLIPYPRDLNIFAENKDDYVEKIEQSLSLPWDLKRVIHAYRWLSFLYQIEEIDISDGYFPKRKGFVNWAQRILSRVSIMNKSISGSFEFKTQMLANHKWLIYAIENGEESHIESFVAALLKQPQESEQIETSLILKCLKQFYKAFSEGDQTFQKKVAKITDQ